MSNTRPLHIQGEAQPYAFCGVERSTVENIEPTDDVCQECARLLARACLDGRVSIKYNCSQ